MVLAQSLFQVLKQRHPGARLDVLAPAWTHPLLARMPEVDEAIAAPFVHGRFDLGARRRLGRELRARHYDRAIVLPNSLKSAIVPFVARARVRTGFTGEWRYGLLNDVRRLDQQKLPRTVDRFVALGAGPRCSAAGNSGAAAEGGRGQGARHAGALEPESARGAGAGAVPRRRIRSGQALAGGIFCRGGERSARRRQGGVAVRLGQGQTRNRRRPVADAGPLPRSRRPDHAGGGDRSAVADRRRGQQRLRADARGGGARPAGRGPVRFLGPAAHAADERQGHGALSRSCRAARASHASARWGISTACDNSHRSACSRRSRGKAG